MDREPSQRRFLVQVMVWQGMMVVVIALVYGGAVDNAFHFDDFDNIVERDSMHLEALSLNGFAAAADGALLRHRVLPNLSFALDWWRGDGEPRAFLQTNVAVHVVAAVLVFALYLMTLRMLARAHAPTVPPGRIVVIASAAALVWALHPIQVQAVSYVVQRMASLVTVFAVLSVIGYLVARCSDSAGARWGGAIACGLGMALATVSKENAAVVPLLLLAAEFGLVRLDRARSFGGRRDTALLLLPVVAGVYLLADVAVIGGPIAELLAAGYAERDFSLAERLLSQPRVVLFYGALYIWPLPGRFSLEHDFAVSTGFLSPPTTVLALAAVIMWTLAAIVLLLGSNARYRPLGFFMSWVPIALCIESSLVPLEMVFEHRMYWPSIGLCGIMAWGLFRLGELGAWPSRIGMVTLAAVAFLLGLATLERLPVFRSALALSANSVEKAPNSARAWNNYANALYRGGRGGEALRAAERALALGERVPDALLILGFERLNQGDAAGARKLLERRVGLGKVDHAVLNTYGEVLLAEGFDSRAAEMFEGAIGKKPLVANYYWNHALALERLGRCADAHARWLEYIELETDAGERARVYEHLEKYDLDRKSCR